MSEEREGTPQDFAGLFGAARAQQNQEPAPAEPIEPPEEPATPAAPAPSLEDLRHEAGVRAGLPPDLTYAVQGNTWAEIQDSATQLSSIWAKHMERTKSTFNPYAGGSEHGIIASLFPNGGPR